VRSKPSEPMPTPPASESDCRVVDGAGGPSKSLPPPAPLAAEPEPEPVRPERDLDGAPPLLINDDENGGTRPAEAVAEEF
jgi:hypothetical protein